MKTSDGKPVEGLNDSSDSDEKDGDKPAADLD